MSYIDLNKVYLLNFQWRDKNNVVLKEFHRCYVDPNVAKDVVNKFIAEFTSRFHESHFVHDACLDRFFLPNGDVVDMTHFKCPILHTSEKPDMDTFYSF